MNNHFGIDNIMNRAYSIFRISIAIIMAVIVSCGCHTPDFTPITNMVIVPRIDSLHVNSGYAIDSSIILTIRYEDAETRFGRKPISLIFTLKNISDSVKYIQGPLMAPGSNNPLFFIKDKLGLNLDDGGPIISHRYPNRDYVKLMGHDSIAIRVIIRGDYNFVRGSHYYIVGTYFSNPAIVRDSLDKRTSWHGIINSNVLNYDY